MIEYPHFQFDITAQDKDSQARCGLLKTPHGTIQTPNFIFCATKGALKGVTTQQTKEAGVDIILSNTYHLMLQPGPDIIEKHGGLHDFLGWHGPMLTDSGGFQIFSLGYGGVANEIKSRGRFSGNRTLLKINEEGARFRSYLDGKIYNLTPERSIQIQRKLRPDFAVVLDECTPFNSTREYTARSMEMSHRWETRSLKEFERFHDGTQALYGIVQGGIYPDLRAISARYVAENPFFGQAIGGSLGGCKDEMQAVVEIATHYLNRNRPTHLLGIGGISDIWNGVEFGIDTFDCTHPTRIARHSGALVHPQKNDGKEHINLKNGSYREDLQPIDEQCPCYCCRNFSRAYIHHLVKAKEFLSGQLLTIHNMTFMMQLAHTIRESIQSNTFQSVKKAWINAS